MVCYNHYINGWYTETNQGFFLAYIANPVGSLYTSPSQGVLDYDNPPIFCDVNTGDLTNGPLSKLELLYRYSGFFRGTFSGSCGKKYWIQRTSLL